MFFRTPKTNKTNLEETKAQKLKFMGSSCTRQKQNQNGELGIKSTKTKEIQQQP